MDLTVLKEALNPSEAAYLDQALSLPIKSIEGDIDIELTVDEIAKALLDAKIKKRALLQYEENDRRRKENAMMMFRPFSAGELVDYCHKFFIERFGNKFNIDNDNLTLVTELSKYFTGDENFNRGEYSLNKGIMIMGNVGTGKSWVMAFFQKNKKQCFKIVPCEHISDEYLIYKEEIAAIYSSPILKPLHDPNVFFQREVGYCFDDLGTEPDKNSFGNKKDVMGVVLKTIYDRHEKQKDFTKFHATTNLNKEDLESRYGSRLFSRFSEMFNIFALNGKDRRKT